MWGVSCMHVHATKVLRVCRCTYTHGMHALNPECHNKDMHTRTHTCTTYSHTRKPWKRMTTCVICMREDMCVHACLASSVRPTLTCQMRMLWVAFLTYERLMQAKPTTWRRLRGWDIVFSCASLYQARRMHTNIQNGRCSEFCYILASWRPGTHTSFVQVAPWVTGRKYIKRSNHVLRFSNWMWIGIFLQNLCKW